MSSIDHDGLGRYGDPLNPNGDIRTMAWLRYAALFVADCTLDRNDTALIAYRSAIVLVAGLYSLAAI